jgi:hypothetical protein
MSPEIPTSAETRLEARKKAKRLALKILRRRRTILKNIHKFSEEFGLRAYVHLEKKSRYGSYDVYSSNDPMHPAIVSRTFTSHGILLTLLRPKLTLFPSCIRRPM